MDDEVRNRNGDVRECSVVVMATNSEVANGFALGNGNGGVRDGNFSGSSSEGFQTYKRRKHAKMSNSVSKLIEDGKVSVDVASQLTDKNTEEPMDIVLPNNSSYDQVSFPRMNSCTTRNSLNDCPLKHWRNTVMEHIYQSLVETDGGIQGCIRDALVFHPESSCTTAAKVSSHFNEDSRKCPSETGRMLNEIQNAAKGHVHVMSSGSLNKSDCHTTTELCQFAFFDIIISEKFAQLCKLLSENFQGLKLDGFFNFDLINSRMKEGAYESKPMLFLNDIQEAWAKLQKVGTEMVALAKSLSDKSRTTFHEQVGHLVHSSFEDNEDEKRNLHTSEQTEACGVYKVCTCRRCKEKADGRDCLVCDSCEEMYHVSCIEPAVEEIPLKNWYCADCTAKGINSPHENCVVCETLNATRSPINEVGDDVILTNEETRDDLDHGSNGLVEDRDQPLEGEKNLHCCNMCGGEVESVEKLRLCGHPFCPHKYYHERCLTSKQLKLYGPSWYCPSCLCGACLTDRDDDKIVLCDACDMAYHIYCLQPPRSSIPDGSWFCRKCDAEIRRIRKAKRTYDNIRDKLKKRGEVGKGAYENPDSGRKDKHEETVDGSGGVDMLLTAAKTLNYEEKMASIR